MAAAVIGGAGALGRGLVTALNESGVHTLCVDMSANDNATKNILLGEACDNASAVRLAATWLCENKEGGRVSVFCVAGGWSGGALDAPEDMLAGAGVLWQQNGVSALLASTIAMCSKAHLLVLTSATAAFGPTPAFPAYGMLKAATNHLVSSAAKAMPDAIVLAIAPETLDTEANRRAMPRADTSRWTPIADIVSRLTAWAHGCNVPASGSILSVITRNGKTELS